MKNKSIFGLVALSLISFSAFAENENVSSKNSIGLMLGTQGFGLSYEKKFNDVFSLELSGSYYSPLQDKRTIDNIDYTTDISVGQAGVYLKYFPTKKNFFLKTGFAKSYLEGNSYNEQQTYNTTIGNFQINGLLNKKDITAKFNFSNAVYLGIGWNKKIENSNWGIKFDLGAYYLGKPDVKFNVNRSNPLLSGISDNDIKKEEENTKKEIGEVYYPMINLTFSYLF